jgi:hypothetical protein
MSKTFEENISRPENSSCAKLVDKLVVEGNFDEKFKLIMDEDDLVNIICLSLIKIYEEEIIIFKYKARFHRLNDEMKRELKACLNLTEKSEIKNSYEKRKQSLVENKPEYIKYDLNAVGKLFSSLSETVRFSLFRSIGIQVISLLDLYDYEGFKQTYEEVVKKYTPNLLAAKPKIDNIEQ